MDLRWLASMSASCFHATRAVIQGQRIVDPALAEALAAPAHEFDHLLGSVGAPRDQFLDQVAALAAGIENNRQLAQVALTKIRGSGGENEALVLRLAGCFAELENAFRRTLPDIVDRLAEQGESLKSNWESQGPELLGSTSRLTDPAVLVERADVVLVYPALGGGGAAQLAYNSVRIEPLAADPHPDLPEVVRLAWLLAQLNLDLPVFSERIPGKRLPRLAGLAMIPPVLAAAEASGLARADDAMTRLALEAWHVEAAEVAETADNLRRWWETFTASGSRWAVALRALDEMIA